MPYKLSKTNTDRQLSACYSKDIHIHAAACITAGVMLHPNTTTGCCTGYNSVQRCTMSQTFHSGCKIRQRCSELWSCSLSLWMVTFLYSKYALLGSKAQPLCSLTPAVRKYSLARSSSKILCFSHPCRFNHCRATPYAHP